MNDLIKIVIADDNRFFCEALKDSLSVHAEFNVINTFTTIEELSEFTNNYRLDVLILDVNFNGKNSLEFIDKIRLKNTDFKIISLTILYNNYIKDNALQKGIDYFISKDSDLSKFKEVILDCYFSNNKMFIENLSSKIKIDNYTFTKRKIEILQALFNYSDKNEKGIAELLYISESSLKSHKRELFEITNTKNTPDLIKFGIQNGLIIT